MMMNSASNGERGSVAVEFAVLGAAIVIAFFSLVAFAGRVQQQDNAVRVASHAAARAASLRDSQGDAVVAAEQVAAANLADRGDTCLHPSVAVGFESFGSDPVMDLVSVTVSCTTNTDGRETTTSHTAVEVIETYRGGP